VETFSKDKKLLFQSGGIENAELCNGITCGFLYLGIHPRKPISMPITKAGSVVNIFFRRLNGRFRQIRAKPLALNFISYGSKIVDSVV
jgi:hypothetical protein